MSNVVLNSLSLLCIFQSFITICTFLGVVYFVGKYSRLTRNVEDEAKYTNKAMCELDGKVRKVALEIEYLKENAETSQDEYAKKIEDWLFAEE